MKTKNIYLTIWQEFGNSNVRQLQIRQVCSAGKLLLFLIFSIMNPNEQTLPNTQQEALAELKKLFFKEKLSPKAYLLVLEIFTENLELKYKKLYMPNKNAKVIPLFS